ncbi:hypothetical protein H4R24_004336 [Coemansia sp. RSA 988]|nr:hypothetical protein H4R24_004336 [Coemansia sp. RSA 988]
MSSIFSETPATDVLQTDSASQTPKADKWLAERASSTQMTIMAVVFAVWAVFAIVLGILIARKRRIQQYQTDSLPEIESIIRPSAERISTRQHKCTLTAYQLHQLPEMSFEEYTHSHNNSEKKLDDVAVVDVPICAICLEAYSGDSVVRGMACAHVFHADCIDRWLLRRSCRCPLCNSDVRGAAALFPRYPSAAKLVD